MASFSSPGLYKARAFLDQPLGTGFRQGKKGYLDKVAFKHCGVGKQVEFWRMNPLTKKAIFHPKFHSRAWDPDLGREAPKFTHWILGRMGWGTSLGLRADPAQLQGADGPLPLPFPPRLPLPCSFTGCPPSQEGLPAPAGSQWQE